MKYCKSKRGYFYKVVGDKKTRISMEEYKAGCKKHAMKGGKLVSDGHLETSNFDFDSGYSNFNEITENKPIIRSKDNPISIMYNNQHIPYVFFGYNRKIGKFRYVMYYDGKTFVFKELGDFVGEIKSPNISSINPDILSNLRVKFKKNFYNTTANEEIQRIYDYLNHINIELKDNSQ
jgi:hypothetical protein